MPGRWLRVVSELGFDISRIGYTVSLVPRERLPHANALIEGANAIGEGIGPSVGGWLFDTLGVALSLLFDFVTYVCSSLLVLLNVLERRKRKTAAASEHTPRQDESARVKTDDENDDDGDVLSGLRFVWGTGSSVPSRSPRASSTSSPPRSLRSTTCSWSACCIWITWRWASPPRAAASAVL